MIFKAENMDLHLNEKLIVAAAKSNMQDKWFVYTTSGSFLVDIIGDRQEDKFKTILQYELELTHGYTRLSTPEQERLDIAILWEDGNRHDVFYHEDLPILKRKNAPYDTIIIGNHSLDIEKWNTQK